VVACAQAVRTLIESETNTILTEDEADYIAIHVARLAN
jgi:transcriptional antiterminator